MTLQEYKNAVLAVLQKENLSTDYSPLFVPEYDQYYENGLKTGSKPGEMAFAIVMLYEFSGKKLKKEEKKVYTLEEYKNEVAVCLDKLNTNGKDYSKYFADSKNVYFEGCMRSESTPQKTAEAIVAMAKWDDMYS